jgi:hypothetical protein
LISAYATNLKILIGSAPQVKIWCFGHIHQAKEIAVGAQSCLVKSNPRGYVDDGQQSGWNSDVVVTIPFAASEAAFSSSAVDEAGTVTVETPNAR